MATTTTQPAMTWQERALFLMEQKRREHSGLAWRGSQIRMWYPDGTPAAITIQIESLSTPDAWHTVTYHVHEDSARCDCVAGEYGRACCHAGVAIRYGREVAAQYTPDGQAEADRMAARDQAHEENAAALGD